MPGNRWQKGHWPRILPPAGRQGQTCAPHSQELQSYAAVAQQWCGCARLCPRVWRCEQHHPAGAVPAGLRDRLVGECPGALPAWHSLSCKRQALSVRTVVPAGEQRSHSRARGLGRSHLQPDSGRVGPARPHAAAHAPHASRLANHHDVLRSVAVQLGCARQCWGRQPAQLARQHRCRRCAQAACLPASRQFARCHRLQDS